MNDRYDVIIVGAGPSGTTAARSIARSGASVLVLEKDRDVGMPVRCGEAVSSRSLEQLVPLDPRWIATTIGRFRLHAPDGSTVSPDIGGIGYVLERRIFDADLARLAADAGAEIVTKAYVDGLLPADSGWRGVSVQIGGVRREVLANIIVGADGVESRVGKWAGIDTTTHIRDMESCAQMTLANVNVDDDACDFYFGADVAPMGYLWVFPKGRRTANVGLGISSLAGRHKSALSYLREFVASRYPHASILSTIAGGVPCAPTLDSIVSGNVVLVGDAAHQVNPMTGGGITSGMLGGTLAADAIVQALTSNDLSRLQAYPAAWDRAAGAKHRTYDRMKHAVHAFPDDVLNAIAGGVLALRPEQRTLWGVFRVALKKHPALIWEMVKTFGLSFTS